MQFCWKLKCMSPSADIEQLKDEVGSPLARLHWTRQTDVLAQGTKFQVVVAGGVAGLVSRFCIAPLDVVKIRLQLQPHSLSDPVSYRGVDGPIYKGAFSTIRAIARQEGIRALWKGNIPAEALYLCYGGLQFASYRGLTQLQEGLPRRLPSSVESFVSGATAGAIATTITYPLDLLRTRFAAQGAERVYTGLAASVSDISRREGVPGFFRGLSAAIGQIFPYMGLFFASYELFHLQLSTLDLPFGSQDAAAGVFASIFAKTCVFPLDLVRKRLQVQGPTRSLYVHRNIPEYRGVFRSLLMIYRKEGYRGCYRGLTVSLFKAAPASAVTMWTYERVLHALMDTNNCNELWELHIPADQDEDDIDME